MKPHWMLDLIACSTMDARAPVALTPAPVEDEPLAAVVVLLRRCAYCRCRDELRATRGRVAEVPVCGELACRRAADARRKRLESEAHRHDLAAAGMMRRR